MTVAADLCTENIGPTQRRRRLIAGLCALAGATLAARLAVIERRPLLATVVFPLSLGGWIGVFEARDRTCVFLAARGEQDMNAGRERLRSEADRQEMRSRAGGVYAKALVAALATTAPVLIWSFRPRGA